MIFWQIHFFDPHHLNINGSRILLFPMTIPALETCTGPWSSECSIHPAHGHVTLCDIVTCHHVILTWCLVQATQPLESQQSLAHSRSEGVF